MFCIGWKIGGEKECFHDDTKLLIAAWLRNDKYHYLKCLSSWKPGLKLEKFDSMLGELNTEQIEKLLQELPVGRIGCHVDGLTYIVPVNYVYDGINLYAHSA